MARLSAWWKGRRRVGNLRVVGFGPFPLPGERRRHAAAEAQARVDLERADPCGWHSGVEYFCATCAVGEGKPHLDWCHRSGVMVHPEPTP